MTEVETLFLRTLEDIENRLSKSDPYEILIISGLIRKLLMDDTPLVDQVNRTYKIKLIFEIIIPFSKQNDDPSLLFKTIQDGLDPDTAPPGRKKYNVNRDQFLKTCVTVIDGHQYTIKDIVKFEANVMGGIHAGNPKTPKEDVLKQIDSTISVGGYASSLRQLKAIARVIVKTLEPLRNAITSD